MRRIKWVAAEFLTDALNARNLAEGRAVEAIERYNRHIEMCNVSVRLTPVELPGACR